MLVAFALGCRSTEPRPTPRELFLARFGGVLAPAGWGPDSGLARELGAALQDSLRVHSRASAAVPGLSYHFGSYRPPNTADLVYWGIAATAPGAAQLVDSVPDWAAVVSATHWTPKTSEDAVAACAEIVTVVGPGRARYPEPVIYRDSTSLPETLSLDVPMLPEVRAALLPRLRPPSASSDAAQWTVRLWAVETGRTVEYECALILPTERDGLAVRLAERAIIPDLGLLTGPPERNPSAG